MAIEETRPRERTWEPLLAATRAPGIHFEDHPELQGLDLPEWSHLSAADADRFTASLVRIPARERLLQPQRNARRERHERT